MTTKSITEVKMIHTKSTPGTFVYTDSSKGAFITSLYIRKDAFQKLDDPPKVITVRVLEED